MIGVGTDIIDVDRIRKSHERHTERFLNRIYTKDEQAYCFGMRNPHPHLAARFAAKEAISKAFSTGIGEHLGWKSMSIAKGERNEPIVVLDEKGKALLKEEIDDGELACAMAVIRLGGIEQLAAAGAAN